MHKTTLVLGILLGVSGVARAQDPNRQPTCVIDGIARPANECGPRPPNGDPLARYLFPPELVMANQQSINLTDRQRSSLVQSIKEAQGKFVDLQFRMSSEVENMQRLIQPASVDESRVLEQVDRVLSVEREIKRAQLSLMIRIKNLLTTQQQAQLRALRGQGSGE